MNLAKGFATLMAFLKLEYHSINISSSKQNILNPHQLYGRVITEND